MRLSFNLTFGKHDVIYLPIAKRRTRLEHLFSWPATKVVFHPPPLHCPADMTPLLLSTFRDDLQVALLEFVGTTFFLLLGLGGIQAATGEKTSGSNGSTVEQVLYIST